MLVHKATITIIITAISIAVIYWARTIARHSSNCIISFNPHNSPMSGHCDGPDFIDEETRV